MIWWKIYGTIDTIGSESLRERLHNRKITMTVRVSAPTENIRAYSHVERFQMMSKKNPNLLKLKEALGLELS